MAPQRGFPPLNCKVVAKLQTRQEAHAGPPRLSSFPPFFILCNDNRATGRDQRATLNTLFAPPWATALKLHATAVSFDEQQLRSKEQSPRTTDESGLEVWISSEPVSDSPQLSQLYESRLELAPWYQVLCGNKLQRAGLPASGDSFSRSPRSQRITYRPGVVKLRGGEARFFAPSC